MENSIKDLLKAKYSIDLDNKDLRELISKQVEEELLKRLNINDRNSLNKEGEYKYIQHANVGIKEKLKETFSKDKIEQQIQGVKQFFVDHSITPQRIKENLSDLISWNNDNPTVNNLSNTFEKVRNMFHKEEEKVNTFDKSEEKLSDKFESLSDMMDEGYKLIDKSSKLKSLEDFENSTKSEILGQKLQLEDDKVEPYDLEKYINKLPEQEIPIIYNYLKDNQNMLTSKNQINETPQQMQFEKEVVDSIQYIESNYDNNILNENRFNTLKEPRTTDIEKLTDNHEIKNLQVYAENITNKMDNTEINNIKIIENSEYEKLEIYKEANDIQNSDIFKQVSQNTNNITTLENEDTKVIDGELIGIDNDNELHIMADNTEYIITLNKEDTDKIKSNNNAFHFEFNKDTQNMTYKENETNESDKKQHNIEDNYMSSLINSIDDYQR